MTRSYYSNTISDFLRDDETRILGQLSLHHNHALEDLQKNAWVKQITILKETLKNIDNGQIYFEFSIPRMGKRIDVLLIIESVIFILEFKIGESLFHSYAVDQVWDYALDLKNFHEKSHSVFIAPILIATKSRNSFTEISISHHNDKVLFPIRSNIEELCNVFENVTSFVNENRIDISDWESGRYLPTPTIIEAAMALYNGHAVNEIARCDASAINLKDTSDYISKIIEDSKNKSKKSICFVTGVPGAGKTLVGLNIATKHIDKTNELYSVFLSGNGPLVMILREALARDKILRAKEGGEKLKKSTVLSDVKMFIQNVHNFRDECLIDLDKAPIEHVTIFDEAQRAWNKEQTSNFMQRKKGKLNFNQSEPEFLISCIERHKDWGVIICLVGGGQEINTGEAGISEWLKAIYEKYQNWEIFISPKLSDSEFNADEFLKKVETQLSVTYNEKLHLTTSMRSFRSENVSLLIKLILDLKLDDAKYLHKNISEKYPIVITRNLDNAKKWLKETARGSERYGIVVSSQAERLKPHAIDVKSPIDPIHWFLDNKDDVRSSFFLEDVATEFHIQGLELDWVCVTWDADFRFSPNGWQHFSFVGNKWNVIRKEIRQTYLKNAYRVLLTRARQGMVIVVPPGNSEDKTRLPEFYNETYNYLKEIGFKEI